MTRPHLLSQSLGEMHAAAEARRRRRKLREAVLTALVFAGFAVMAALITVALRAAATVTPPTF